MTYTARDILAVLDQCCESFSFPMLDNGYVYLAATRLSLYRSRADWAMVIEVFGYSPRAGLPDIHVHTFASRLHKRDEPDKYVTAEAYQNYLVKNPHNDSRFFFPIAPGSWQDAESLDFVAVGARTLSVRRKRHPIPTVRVLDQIGIKLEQPPRIKVFELCRYLAAVARDQVLATARERRVSVLPKMKPILRLEEWRHPNLVAGELPSGSKTFQQLAQVLVSGNAGDYVPSHRPNTHWRHWPEGGTL